MPLHYEEAVGFVFSWLDIEFQTASEKDGPLRRWRIPGLVDRIEVDDPKEISEIVENPSIDREFYTPTSLINWFLLKRTLIALSVDGKKFPTLTPRASSEDARERDALWKELEAKIPSIRKGPVELEALAQWVRNSDSDAVAGIVVQQLLGSLFSEQFVATEESWHAAQVLVKAPRLTNLPKLVWWTLSGKVHRAKRLLSGMVGGNLSGVNAIGIAVHNVVKGLERMRQLYADEKTRSSLSGEAVANDCVFAPISLYRQAISEGAVQGCPFSRGSLFVLNIGSASSHFHDRRIAFLEDSWSRCPAAEWVPAMFEGVWKRARSAGDAGSMGNTIAAQ